MYKFAPASESESSVFGAAKPGYSSESVRQWLEFMQSQNIKRVCCLLSKSQLTRYSDLLGVYQQTFGFDRLLWTPIEDFQLVDSEILTQQIMPFLIVADRQNEKVVVHCSGGIGRTGQILAAWLVAKGGFSNQEAIAAVRKTGRNPYEAAIFAPLKGRNPWKVVAELNRLLDDCRRVGEKLI